MIVTIELHEDGSRTLIWINPDHISVIRKSHIHSNTKDAYFVIMFNNKTFHVLLDIEDLGSFAYSGMPDNED